MKIKGTDWYTAVTSKITPNGLYTLLTYRRSLAGKSEREIEEMQQALAEEGVVTKVKSSRHNHTGIRAGTLFLQVADRDSVDKLERIWGERGIELDPHRYDEYSSDLEKKSLSHKIDKKGVPAWDSFLAWDLIQVFTRDGVPATTCRINLSRYNEEEQQKLQTRLAKLGILGIKRVATAESESVKPNDVTWRVAPQSVRDLDALFVDKPDPANDWRNMHNWEGKKVYDKYGVEVPYFRYRLQDMSPAEEKHLEKTLKMCGIGYGIEVEEDSDYMRVMGASEVKSLRMLTAPWTPQGSKVRTRSSGRIG